ncbi:hypothetical protein ACF1E9_04255 [Streptomyces roseolus]|uniref:hypothetical protein n=1 Tax=Streptomyces roseolus TaxID=67358 RepID=UPI0036FAA4AA
MNDRAPASAPVSRVPVSSAPPAVPVAGARALRRGALWAGLLFLPATVFVWIAAVATERGGRCLTYGTCGDVPGGLFQATLVVAGVAWLAALTTPGGAPPSRVRWAALWTLIAAELFFLCLVLGHYTG